MASNFKKKIALVGFYILILPLQVQAASSNEKIQSDTRKLSILVKGQNLSIAIANVKLSEVLKKLSFETGIKITVTEERAQEPITLSFTGLPIDKGVQRILKNNYSLIYGSAISDDLAKESDNLAVLNEIKVHNDLSGKKLIAKKKPEIYKLNPQKLAERVLKFGDEPGRIEILERIQQQGLDVNLKQLENHASSDKSIPVRQLALEEIANRLKPKAAEAFLQKTIQSELVPEVKTFAENLLSTIKEENAWIYKK